MDASKNEISFDYANNPDLAEIFSGKKPGDKCSIELDLMVKEADEKKARCVIEKVSYDTDTDDTKEAEPAPDEPMKMDVGPSTSATE